jgi:uncharacterized protein (TIGR02452 family)
MASREGRAQIARETLAILEQGHYTHSSGQEVSIRADLDSARSRSVHYAPEHFDDVLRRCGEIVQGRAHHAPTAFEVADETTLHAARRLVEEDRGARVLALNFASAKNPGGGFLGGSQAQEESLARASGLYACISQFPAMYEANRRHGSCLYTDHMIYTPDVPVFRDDDDRLLGRPCAVSFVTAPAPNAGAIRKNEPHNAQRIRAVLNTRIEKILALSILQEHHVLVLGGWGCGVFANDPAQVAEAFADHLTGDGAFAGIFSRVVFAIFDRTSDRTVMGPFAKAFPSHS